MSKNSDLLKEFVSYCEAHPEYRFWQALRNWCGKPYVIVSNALPIDAGFERSWQDTFYWNGKHGNNAAPGEEQER